MAMTATLRPYRHGRDYEAIGRFLVETYATGGAHVNWMQPRWEYMHFHPLIENVDLDTIGVWVDGGRIVAVAHPEHGPGRAYFQVRPGCEALRPEMLAYAERHLRGLRHGRRVLQVLINDRDTDFQRWASAVGYERLAHSEPMSVLPLGEGPGPIRLPAGFRLISLADDNDLPRLTRLIWRGFDHGDEPPDDGLAERRLMQSAPNYRRDLNIVAVAPDGTFASYCGMWIEPAGRLAYVEPVCTDPAYRRRGLATAAITEGIRRCAAGGAAVACVGSAQPVYLAMGFRPLYTSSLWQRIWT
ncbi:MAG: GNAT family N-acetyltransferase [Planctomycetes bacterium]|nr:GNAT family N-acetyltransferase [Planctomycetota bacterium]